MLLSNFCEAVEMLLKQGYKIHHSATHRGYHSVKCVTVNPYKGRFGEGFIIEHNDPRTTNYHTVTYLTK